MIAVAKLIQKEVKKAKHQLRNIIRRGVLSLVSDDYFVQIIFFDGKI